MRVTTKQEVESSESSDSEETTSSESEDTESTLSAESTGGGEKQQPKKHSKLNVSKREIITKKEKKKVEAAGRSPVKKNGNEGIHNSDNNKIVSFTEKDISDKRKKSLQEEEKVFLFLSLFCILIIFVVSECGEDPSEIQQRNY